MKGDANLRPYQSLGHGSTFFDINCSVCGQLIIRVMGTAISFAIHKIIPSHICDTCLYSDKLHEYIKARKEGKEWVIVK